MAAALTAALYGLITLMAVHPSIWTVPRHRPPLEIIAKLVIVPVQKTILLIPPKFPTHLVKPPAQTASPPVFIIASDTPPPQATAPPPAAPSLSLISAPVASGAPAGSGNGQGGTANGVSGTALSGCFDAVWGKAVSDRIGKFYFYPPSERRRQITGVAFVHIGVNRYGRLALLKINKSSGVRALDNAALGMVRQAVPLPWIPKRMHLSQVDVELPVAFGKPDPSLTPTPGSCASDENIIVHH
jgi:protein TonB